MYYEKYRENAVEAAKALKKDLEGMRRHAYTEKHDDEFPHQLSIQLGRWLQKNRKVTPVKT
jgi:hypothetical protein